MPVRKYSDLLATAVRMEGAKNVFKKIPVGASEGWEGYTLRTFTLEPGGHTPRYSHDWEHVNYIIRGRGILMIDGKDHEVSERDFAFVPPNSAHQFSNPNDEVFEFICIVPNRGEY
ncbi:MAG: cupin domain-containing protein [Deltaproteobacteria bacterium]|nr:MAG: cupin domain-containing protein [Deltaproteobacteria bacterium]